ncbi:MAG: hypothetical protein SGCHY_005164, partial [Lobulomycetales sp.]
SFHHQPVNPFPLAHRPKFASISSYHKKSPGSAKLHTIITGTGQSFKVTTAEYVRNAVARIGPELLVAPNAIAGNSAKRCKRNVGYLEESLRAIISHPEVSGTRLVPILDATVEMEYQILGIKETVGMMAAGKSASLVAKSLANGIAVRLASLPQDKEQEERKSLPLDYDFSESRSCTASELAKVLECIPTQHFFSIDEPETTPLSFILLQGIWDLPSLVACLRFRESLSAGSKGVPRVFIETAAFMDDLAVSGIALNLSWSNGEAEFSQIRFTAENRSVYEADMESIKPGCTCYACQNHSKAYLSHLFVVGDLLGFTLIQLHNIHQLENFTKSRF